MELGLGHYWLIIDLVLGALVVGIVVWIVRTRTR